MDKLPENVQSLVQLQIAEIFFNAENPTLQRPITQLSNNISSTRQHISAPLQTYHSDTSLCNSSTRTHSEFLAVNSATPQYHNSSTPLQYHISENTTPQDQQHSSNGAIQREHKQALASVSPTLNPERDILAESTHIINGM